MQNNSSMFTKKNVVGPTEIWTRIAGFRVQNANHYTMGPFVWQISTSIKQRPKFEHFKSTTTFPTKMTLAHARSAQLLSIEKLWLILVFVLVLRTGNITQHCNNFISIVKTYRFWSRIHLYYWTAVPVWKGSTDVTGLLHTPFFVHIQVAFSIKGR